MSVSSSHVLRFLTDDFLCVRVCVWGLWPLIEVCDTRVAINMFDYGHQFQV